MIYLLVVLLAITFLNAAYYYSQFREVLAAIAPLGTVEVQQGGHKCIVKFDKISAVVDKKVHASNAKMRWLVRVESGKHEGAFGKVVVLMGKPDNSIFIEDLSFSKLYKLQATDFVQRIHLRHTYKIGERFV
jgi:hypothetical protein